MSLSPAELIKATLLSYKNAAKLASLSLKRNWIIMPATVLAYFAFEVVAHWMSPFGMAGGFILGIFQVFLLSLFYLWLEAAQERAALKLRDLVRFDYGMFSAVISVAFIIFLANYLTGMTEQTWKFPLTLFFNTGLFLACNAIPEVIYINRYESVVALKESFEFTKNNLIEWFLPLIVLSLPILLTDSTILLQLVTGADTLLPSKLLIDVVTIGSVITTRLAPESADAIQGYVTLLHLLAIVVATWFMIFRGFLFHELSGGTRRQRIFAAKQR